MVVELVKVINDDEARQFDVLTPYIKVVSACFNRLISRPPAGRKVEQPVCVAGYVVAHDYRDALAGALVDMATDGQQRCRLPGIRWACHRDAVANCERYRLVPHLVDCQRVAWPGAAV